MNTENSVIKVMGIGRLGSSAINHMIEQGMQHVEFSLINADTQTQNPNLAGSPPQSEDAAIGKSHANHECFNALISGAGIVILIAEGENSEILLASSMAKFARKMDALTIAILISPLSSVSDFPSCPDEQIKSLHDQTDVLILMPSSGGTDIPSDGTSSPRIWVETLNSLRLTIEAIAGAIKVPGLVNLDVTDFRTIMSNSGIAITGTDLSSGQNRAKLAAQRAIRGMDISGAHGVWVHITSSSSLRLSELAIAMECVELAAEYSFLLVSSSYEETIGEYLRVTVHATGLSVPQGIDYSSASQC